MQPKWNGPYTVEESLEKGLYRLKNHKTGKTLKNIINVTRLKEYTSAEVVSPNDNTPPETLLHHLRLFSRRTHPLRLLSTRTHPMRHLSTRTHPLRLLSTRTHPLRVLSTRMHPPLRLHPLKLHENETLEPRI